MAKQIKFSHNGKEYTLEFTRKSIERMERQGFKINEVVDKPMNTLPTLFAGAFIAHHPFLKREVIDEIFDKITNKAELIDKLIEMYSEPIAALTDEPEGNEGNVSWEASW